MAETTSTRIKSGLAAATNLGVGLAHVLNPLWWSSRAGNRFSPEAFHLDRRASAWYRADLVSQSLRGRSWAKARQRWQTAAYEQVKDLPAGEVMPLDEFDWRNRPLEQLHRQYIDKCRPVVLRGAMKQYTELQRWRFDELVQRFADEPVRLSCPVNADYVGTVAELDIPGVYIRAVESLMNRHPELYAEMGLERFGADLRGRLRYAGVTQLFLGRKKTGTRWHAAPVQNLFMMLDGKKKWSFIDPAYSPLMSPTHSGGDSLYLLSEAAEQTAMYEAELELLDPADRMEALRASRSEHGRLVQALYSKCPRYEVELEPGDVLASPPWWWHEVENLTETSVGAATRWFDPQQWISPNMNFEAALMLRPGPAYSCSVTAFAENFMTMDCKLVADPPVEAASRNVEDASRGSDHEVAPTREDVEAYYARQRAAMVSAVDEVA